MTTIFFYYIFIQLILNLFFTTNKSVALCGITSFCPRVKLTKEQKDKVWRNCKLIAMYNLSRGKDSCGMLLNGKKYAGWRGFANEPDTSLISDFFAHNSELKYEEGVIMIHTRASTVGANVAKNC